MERMNARTNERTLMPSRVYVSGSGEGEHEQSLDQQNQMALLQVGPGTWVRVCVRVCLVWMCVCLVCGCWFV